MIDKTVKFDIETFTDGEKAILNRYFTNTDKAVFGLINLPDVVKGALFARYSRSGKSLRRLFLDEFYTGVSNAQKSVNVDVGIHRASLLYDRMILDFGDDSVAQLGGAHIACEQVSNVLTKILEKGRLAAYLEQSTRYIYYNEKIDGKYRYMIPPEIADSKHEKEYCKYMDSLFDTYTEIQRQILPVLEKKYPAGEQSERAWKSTIKAKACDIVRGLLPAATRSNLGIFANGQTFEYLLIKMFASNNAEVIAFADMMLEELRKIIPAFLTRVDLDDRGKLWSNYLKTIEQELKQTLAKTVACNQPKQELNTVELIDWDDDALDKVLQSVIFEYSFASSDETANMLKNMTETEKIDMLKKYCGNRSNRRHKPGRAFENTSYKFEILSDYGAFRDLQRHRILTILWQKLSPANGYVVPCELEEFPQLKSLYENALHGAENIYNSLKTDFGDDIAQYVIPFAYRVRYEISMNLREAIHFIELRSQKQGHSSYRQISVDMYNLIAQKAKHQYFTNCMKFVDTNFYELAREDAENRKDLKINDKIK
ncbi:MAG: FAD-dependent thymidylate synthase [Prevotellaceae bacterium]|jgi:thymidylate synthase ThyX|nr:FAD-dependent thymidylate synthase [Prevotellaceae bacterium]